MFPVFPASTTVYTGHRKNKKKDGAPPTKRGRPSGTIDEMKRSSFPQVIEYLENNDDETVTLDELYEIMEGNASSGEVYSKKSLQRQLYAHYGIRVSITSMKQQPLVVTLTSNVKQLIQEAHSKIKTTLMTWSH